MVEIQNTGSKNMSMALELYGEIDDQKKVSVDLLYNAICYFDLEPEQVISMLNGLSEESCAELDSAFKQCRDYVRKMRENILEEGNFSEFFHSPEVEDILFYQIAHGISVS